MSTTVNDSSGNTFNKDVNNIAANLDNYYADLKKNAAYLFFQPDVSQIKTKDTGKCFTKPEYNTNQANPMVQIPGLHTEETCKMNVGKRISNMKWSNNFTPGNGETASSKQVFKEKIDVKVPGLTFKVINKYFNDDVAMFNDEKLVKEKGQSTLFSNLTGATRDVNTNTSKW